MFGVLEASWFEVITMEEPFRGHSFKLSFLYFPYLLAFVRFHWRHFHPHIPFSFSVCHVFQPHFTGASHYQWHWCTQQFPQGTLWWLWRFNIYDPAWFPIQGAILSVMSWLYIRDMSTLASFWWCLTVTNASDFFIMHLTSACCSGCHFHIFLFLPCGVLP